MKQIIIISGKGGTGKTVIAGSLAAIADNKVLADCDVDAADLHLLLHPKIKKRFEFKSGKTAVVDKKKCIECKKCIEVCRFNSIDVEPIRVNSISCEGCSVCFHVCPVNAINMKPNLSGHWFISETEYGPLVHAELAIAEENSGKLVTLVRQQSKKIAEDYNLKYVIVDGSPGIGCPVIASLSGADLAIIVTEPTLSGIHDLKRILQLTRHFNIKSGCVINKYNMNLDNAKEIEKFLIKEKISILAKIPFSKEIVESVEKSLPLPKYASNGINELIVSLWQRVKKS